jgi:hypothetical protein
MARSHGVPVGSACRRSSSGLLICFLRAADGAPGKPYRRGKVVDVRSDHRFIDAIECAAGTTRPTARGDIASYRPADTR